MTFIKHIRVHKGITAAELVDKFKGIGFGARALGEAAQVWEEMVNDKGTVKFLGVGGALVAGGLREVLMELIENRFVDAVVTTGANLTHDLIEAEGSFHEVGSADANDSELKQENLMRVYDTYVKQEGYSRLEDIVQELLPSMGEREYTTAEFLKEFGTKLNKRSILSVAAKAEVPVFAPAFGDSIFGFQVWMYMQNHKLSVNPLKDQKQILDLAYDAKKTGAVILGGGVSKNYVTQAVQMAEKPLSYGVQITLDSPEGGGASGAPLSEAISWGKVAPDARTAEVKCDITIALPLLLAYLKGV